MLYQRKTIGQRIGEKVAEIISGLNPIQTDWSYISFDSGGGSIGTPGVELSIGLTGGVLTVQKQGDPKLSVKCGSVDGGVGISPVPFNVSFPLPGTPGKGIIYLMPNSGGSLRPNSFRGGYVGVTAGIGCGPTAGISFLFMGAKFLPLPGMDISSLVAKLALSSEAMVVAAGISGSLPDIGITGSVGVSI
ncbi:MAG: hypothetical protein R2747_20165 [Pyrinomonadaceae bacterium]